MRDIFKVFSMTLTMACAMIALPAMANTLTNAVTQGAQLATDSVVYAHSQARIDYDTKVLGLKTLNDALGQPLHQDVVYSLKKELRLQYEQQERLERLAAQQADLQARQEAAAADYAERAAALEEAKQNLSNRDPGTASTGRYRRVPGTGFDREY